MSNSLTGFSSQNVQAQVLDVLRQNAVFPRLAFKAPGTDGVNRGSTIDFPKTGAITARAISAAVTPATNQDITTTRVQLTIGTWSEASWYLTDQEAAHLRQGDGNISEQMKEAIKSLANEIDLAGLKACYQGAYHNVGVPGTTPFSATSVTHLAQARRLLSVNLAGPDRFFVMDPLAESAILPVGNVLQAEQYGGTEVIRGGRLAQVLGFDCFVDQNISTVTVTTLNPAWVTGYTVATAAAAAGASSMIVINSTATGSANAGVVFKSGAGYYVVNASIAVVATTNVTLTFSPVLATAAASGDAITIVATYTPNVYMAGGALAFASRIAAPMMGRDDTQSVVDPVSGIALTMAITREYYQTTARLSCLYGWKAVRPEHIGLIFG